MDWTYFDVWRTMLCFNCNLFLKLRVFLNITETYFCLTSKSSIVLQNKTIEKEPQYLLFTNASNFNCLAIPFTLKQINDENTHNFQHKKETKQNIMHSRAIINIKPTQYREKLSIQSHIVCAYCNVYWALSNSFFSTYFWLRFVRGGVERLFLFK